MKKLDEIEKKSERQFNKLRSKINEQKYFTGKKKRKEILEQKN